MAEPEKERTLDREEVVSYTNSVEAILAAQLTVANIRSELDAATVELGKTKLQHSQLLRRLSQKYNVPFYDNKHDVDFLTGKIQPRKDA